MFNNLGGANNKMVDDEDKNDKRRNRRNPFDLFGMDEFERMFREMERMMEEAFKDSTFKNIKPGRSFVHGFNIHVGPDGKPHFSEFGNRSLKNSDGKKSFTEEREPLTDVIESKDEVAVTVEIPGVEKQDIDLKATTDNLEIHVNTAQRKYHKNVDLPCSVKPKTTKATYKNGVLDVSIKKKQKDSDDGYKVNIK